MERRSLADGRCPLADRRREISAEHEIVSPDDAAQSGVISDLDDTVIETNVTSFLTAAKLTLLGNAKTRKPLEGVAALYSSLHLGAAGRPLNPIFYVSSSPWNLYDLLCEFLQLNEIPKGPIFLGDYGIDRTKFIKKRGHRDKLDRTLVLMAAFPTSRLSSSAIRVSRMPVFTPRPPLCTRSGSRPFISGTSIRPRRQTGTMGCANTSRLQRDTACRCCLRPTARRWRITQRSWA